MWMLTFKIKARTPEGCIVSLNNFYYLPNQAPMCQPKQLQCVKEVKIQDHSCFKSCEGFYVNSYFDYALTNDSYKDFWSKVEADYDKYKLKQKFIVPFFLTGNF